MRRVAVRAASAGKKRSGRPRPCYATGSGHGVPLALYTDWKNVYVRAATPAERARGPRRTQFGRMCAALQIRIIPASSPQAKGRIERNHGTHQDRLVKKLRRLAVAEDARGEHLSRDHVLAAAQCALLAGAGVGRTTFIGGVLPRGGSWIRYFGWRRRAPSSRLGRALPQSMLAARAAERACAGPQTVVVYEDPAGRLEIRYRNRVMRWTEIAASAAPPHPRPAAAPAAIAGRRRRPVRRPARADHPWRQGFKQMGRDVPYWQFVDR